MYLVNNKWVIAVKVSNFSGQYLRNHWTLDVGVSGYIVIVWPKEHSPEVRSFPPGTSCIFMSLLIKYYFSYEQYSSAQSVQTVQQFRRITTMNNCTDAENEGEECACSSEPEILCRFQPAAHKQYLKTTPTDFLTLEVPTYIEVRAVLCWASNLKSSF